MQSPDPPAMSDVSPPVAGMERIADGPQPLFSGVGLRRRGGRRALLVVLLSLGQLMAALLTLVLVWTNIRLILLSGPSMALLGFSVALTASCWGAWGPVLYGLSAPLVTGVAALIISAHRLGPMQAVVPIGLLLLGYALIAAPWVAVVLRRLGSAPGGVPASASGYSLRSLMLFTTAVCGILGLARALTWMGAMGVFAAYGLSMLLLSLLIVGRFASQRRGRGGVRR